MKTLKIKSLFLTFILLGLTTISSAESNSVFAEFKRFCSDTVCNPPYEKQVVFDSKQSINLLSDNELSIIKKASFDQAQIWGDTILEGDYFANGQTELVTVAALFKENRFVGFQFTYQEKAWFTGNCSPGPSYKNLSGCQIGKIVESSFISQDLKSVENDFDAIASFIPNL